MTDQEKRSKILKILEEAHRIWFEEYHMKPDINGIIADLLIKENENYNISETKQKQEIESLKAENERLAKVVSEKVYDFIDNVKEVADTREAWEQQAKIDALKELKKRSCCDNFFTDGKWHRYVFIEDIDKLIEEIEK